MKLETVEYAHLERRNGMNIVSVGPLKAECNESRWEKAEQGVLFLTPCRACGRVHVQLPKGGS